MLALIMAGGEGSRLGLGEKPLVSVAGIPMLSRVIAAFASAGCDIVVVTSGRTPMTRNYCRARGIDQIPAEGKGFIEDMAASVMALSENGPLFVSVSDIPCIDAEIIGTIRSEYGRSGKDACSTWVPLALMNGNSGREYRETVNGTDACPAGVNILRGDLISEVQDEFRLLLSEPRLAVNVNTRADLLYAESLFAQGRSS